MGYRSDVKLLVAERVYNLILHEAEQSTIENVKIFIQQPDSVVFNEETKSVLITWEDVKWYSGYYPEIILIENILDDLDNLVNDCDDIEKEEEIVKDNFYKFVRIGEDSNDNEERTNDNFGDYTGELYIVRSFSM